ncbi:Protein of unknown function [Pyronema omphalodes CBS 100304]|uniref:Uncharacterized protein n=1 Tax=Pyronema omphalodes (strain CBS 100304) TaxID=1076935 RepID=U4L688_PYROM|nr:Protein of unknown function [Pyronema omphalodes CBS 100304]
MSAEEIQKLVVRQLIDRVKCRLAVINAEENLNPQKQYDTYCGADNCVCLEDRLEDPSAIRDDDKDVNDRNDANDSNGEDDILWDWNGGIWC